MASNFGPVQPGDLITAEFINGITAVLNSTALDVSTIYGRLAAVENAVITLEQRVSALEQLLSPPSKGGKDTKEDVKDGKDSKDSVKEGKEAGKDNKDSKDSVKEGKEAGKDNKDNKDASKEGKEAVKDNKDNKDRKDAEKHTIKERIAEKVQVETKRAPLEQLKPSETAQTASSFAVEAATAVDDPVEHFIPTALRPDLTVSALNSEDDFQNGTGGH